MLSRFDDIQPLLDEARFDPKPVLRELRALAASASWQEREVAATALVALAKRHPAIVLARADKWAQASHTQWIIRDG